MPGRQVVGCFGAGSSIAGGGAGGRRGGGLGEGGATTEDPSKNLFRKGGKAAKPCFANMAALRSFASWSRCSSSSLRCLYRAICRLARCFARSSRRYETHISRPSITLSKERLLGGRLTLLARVEIVSLGFLFVQILLQYSNGLERPLDVLMLVQKKAPPWENVVGHALLADRYRSRGISPARHGRLIRQVS